MGEIFGKDGADVAGRARQTVWERMATQEGSRLNTVYELHRFDVPGLADKVAINSINHSSSCTCGRAAGAFALLTRAAQVTIRNQASVELFIRFNANTADPVPLPAGDDMYWTWVETTNLFFSNPNSALGQTIQVGLG